MKKIIVLLLSILLLVGCNNKEKESNTLEEVLKENNYIIVDVRTKEEYDTSHVVGSINIPYDTIDENTDLDKSKTIMVYCRSGKRSSIAAETLKNLGYDKDYKINYGYNYFPKKKYKSVTYKEGMYESLVITLGTGEGDNWWCVLFPPLCLVEADESTTSDAEYTFFIKEIIDKYTK